MSHHSPKSFEKLNYVTLENMLRGSGDIGAMLSLAWGFRLLDRGEQTRVQVENLKPRDCEALPPFQILGRPHIDKGLGFQLSLKPGECGRLEEVLGDSKPGRKKSEEKAARHQLLVGMVKQGKTETEIWQAVKNEIEQSTFKKELRQARSAAKAKY